MCQPKGNIRIASPSPFIFAAASQLTRNRFPSLVPFVLGSESSSDATPTSTIDFQVFHKSQSKKKGKKRNLVASASYSLGELFKKSEHAASAFLVIGSPLSMFIKSSETHTYLDLDIRLGCRPDGKAVASRGRPQNKASLQIRLRAPENLAWRRNTVLSSTEDEQACNPGLCMPSSYPPFEADANP